jgi:hypothetical protein
MSDYEDNLEFDYITDDENDDVMSSDSDESFFDESEDDKTDDENENSDDEQEQADDENEVQEAANADDQIDDVVEYEGDDDQITDKTEKDYNRLFKKKRQLTIDDYKLVSNEMSISDFFEKYCYISNIRKELTQKKYIVRTEITHNYLTSSEIIAITDRLSRYVGTNPDICLINDEKYSLKNRIRLFFTERNFPFLIRREVGSVTEEKSMKNMIIDMNIVDTYLDMIK